MKRQIIGSMLFAGLIITGSGCGGSGGGPKQPPPQAIEWWTGAVHGTAWGRFALQNSSEGSPTSACDGPRVPEVVEPSAWWSSVGPAITGGSDAVGYTVWSNEKPGCSRAMQTIYRSVMTADLSTLLAKNTQSTPISALINTAELEFSVIRQPTGPNPLGWACYEYAGGVGLLSTLRPEAVVSAGLTQAGGEAGSVTAEGVVAAFPRAGTPLEDLSVFNAAGTRGRATATDTGPGIHAFRVDVKDVLVGALNNNRPTLGFTVAGIREGEIVLNSDVQFACRTWVQPHRLRVTHW